MKERTGPGVVAQRVESSRFFCEHRSQIRLPRPVDRK